MKPFEYYIQPIKEESIQLTGDIIQEDTGCFDSITIINLNERNSKGEPTVKVLVTNKPQRITHGTSRKRTEKSNTCIMIAEGSKTYTLSQTKISTYTWR